MSIQSKNLAWLKDHRPSWPSPLTIATVIVCAVPVAVGFAVAEEEPALTEQILVPRRQVGAYRFLTCDQLRRVTKPAESVPDDAIRTCAAARGRVTRQSLGEGATIRERQLTAKVRRQAVEGRTPVSLVAPSIPQVPEPGSRVNVVLTPTTPTGNTLVLLDVMLLDLEPSDGDITYVVAITDEQLDAIAQGLGTSRVTISPGAAVAN